MIETEKDLEIYNKGLIQGQKHTAPSPKTIELFKGMEKQINDLRILTMEQQKDIEYIKKTLDGFIAKADTCYASRSSVDNVKENHNKEIKAIQDNHIKLEAFMTKVMWTAITSLIGFLVTIIWFLIQNFIV